jgi:hypothetical protein
MNWILVLLLVSASGSASSTIEMPSKAACYAAIEQAKHDLGTGFVGGFRGASCIYRGEPQEPPK